MRNYNGVKVMFICCQGLRVLRMKYLLTPVLSLLGQTEEEWLHPDPIVNECGLCICGLLWFSGFFGQKKEHHQKNSNPFNDVLLCGIGLNYRQNTLRRISGYDLHETEARHEDIAFACL